MIMLNINMWNYYDHNNTDNLPSSAVASAQKSMLNQKE